MAVKILIKRKVPSEHLVELTTLTKKLRALTLEQNGYIFGETLGRVDQKDEYVVISNWLSLKDWNNWINNPKRIEVQMEIDKILKEETEYAIYSTA